MVYRFVISFIIFPLLSTFTAETEAECINLSNPPASRGEAFIPNQGQWDDEVKFLARTGGMNVWITESGILFDFYRNKLTKDDQLMKESHVVKMNLKFKEETSPTFHPSGEKKRYISYFRGNDPSRWVSSVPVYEEVIIKSAFGKDSGIDIRLYYDKGLLRYDFILSPGANVEDILFSLEGADKIWIDSESGDLFLNTRLGEVRHSGLMAYQELDGEIREVEGNFRLTETGEVGFDAEWVDHSKVLVIDPLIASTFLGGSDMDVGESIAFDDDGNVYVAGYTTSANFPTTTGAYNESFTGTRDFVISVFNAGLSDLLYSTYVGGSDDDRAFVIRIGSNGNVYVAGRTQSSDFPTTPGAYDQTYNGGGNDDVVILVLSLDLSNLIYSTFLGGSGHDRPGANGLMLDSDNKVYVTGETYSENFPTTSGAYKDTLSGGTDSFISVLSTDLSSLDYSTYLGGSASDYGAGRGIAVNSDGNIYVTGRAASADWPTTPGAYDTTISGSVSVYVSALTPDLSTILYSTYIGGPSSSDQGYDIAIGSDDNVYVTGHAGNNFPTTPGVYRETWPGGTVSIFVSTFTADLSTLLYSTYIGGSGGERAESILLDSEGNAYLTGFTNSDNFPTTPGAHDIEHNVGSDGFVTAITADLSTLIYSSYLGGLGADYGTDIVLDFAGNTYVTGRTNSANFPVTGGAYDEEYNGSFDIFVSKLEILPLPGQVELAYPENGETANVDTTGSTIYIELGWEEANPFVTTYHLEISTDAGFSNLVYDNNSITDTSFEWDGVEENTMYWWRVRAWNGTGWGPVSDAWSFDAIFVSTGDDPSLPLVFSLSQNYPNPFNPSTSIRYGLPERSVVKIEVYNTLGQRVTTLVDTELEAGFHEIEWHSGRVASGVYYYRIEAVSASDPSNRFIQMRSMVFLK